MTYTVVTTEAQLQDRLAAGGCCVAAGMTDLYPAGQMPSAALDVVDLSRVPSLRGIQHSADGWRIGAATRWTDLLHHPWPAGLTLLAEVARQVGAVQVQNAGTLGGNLCNASPAADGVPALMALNASIEVNAAGATRTVPLADFITGVRQTALRDGEYVSAILLPEVVERSASAFVKLGVREYLVISIAMAAAVLQCDADGRVVHAGLSIGACSPVAVRLPAIEAALRGQAVSPSLVDCVTAEQIASRIQPIDDVRASAAYRHRAAVQVVRDTLAIAIERVT